ncbi:MAG: hypothetical protein PHI11_07285 [Gallionella sp.]|nr:hypothetical protein [Gallionella sp.]
MPNVSKEIFVSFETYLAGEREVEVRSEYVDGYIYAMAGASKLHNTVAGEFYISPVKQAYRRLRKEEGLDVPYPMQNA